MPTESISRMNGQIIEVVHNFHATNKTILTYGHAIWISGALTYAIIFDQDLD